MITATAVGRLGRDAETRSTQQGTEVTSFSIAVDQGYGDKKTTLWADCAIWGERGRKLKPYLVKGTQVVVSGEPSLRSWNKPDGSSATSLTIRVGEVKLIGGRQDGGSSDSGPRQDGGGGRGTPVSSDDDDEIPF